MKKAEKTDLEETKVQRFFSGKGFYIALALSLAAVGGAAWFGVDSALDSIEAPVPKLSENQPVKESDEWTMPEQKAEIKQDDIKAESKIEIKEEDKPTANAVVQGFILPLKGTVVNTYSGDKVIKSKTLDEWVMHTGMDIAAPISTPVKAMSGGKVKEIKNDTLWGTTVTIEHANGVLSYYANLKSAVNVKQNSSVKMGDVIGTVGDTSDIERAEESHLHFGVKKDGQWVDPMSIIK